MTMLDTLHDGPLCIDIQNLIVPSRIGVIKDALNDECEIIMWQPPRSMPWLGQRIEIGDVRVSLSVVLFLLSHGYIEELSPDCCIWRKAVRSGR